MRPALRIIALVLVAAVGAIVALIIAFGLYLDSDDPPDIDFDATAWRAATRSSGLRSQMADHLIDSRALEGMTRAEVPEILGEPSSDAGGRYDYVLGGPTDGFFEGFENLLAVEFDDSGRVERVFRHSD